jgi:flagellar protein FlgJ
VAAQLEGVFIRQLFKAMRETVPEGGALETGAGTEMFRDLMDEHLADEMAGRLRTGVGEAVYRQIRSGERAAPAEPGRGREGPR